MRIDPEQRQRINIFYSKLLAKHGTKSAKTLDWLKNSDQELRFKILSEIGNLNNRSILDFGCGIGDLYGYLSKHFKNFKYTGLDINPELISEAKKKYPKAKFIPGELSELEKVRAGLPKFDYIFASGSLSFNFPGAEKYYFDLIHKFYKMARHGLAFNMLDRRFYTETKVYKVYSHNKVAKLCASITNNYKVILGYEEGDFTIFINK